MTREEVCEHLKKYHRGKENPISSKRLERMSGVSGRTIRKYVHRLRQEGKPICSDQNGYYYAEEQQEVNETVSRLNEFITRIGNARTGLMFAKVIPSGGDEVVCTIRTVIRRDGSIVTEVTP